MSRLFGAITQNGYVVRNIAAAMQHWIDVLGVGPWYYAERAAFATMTAAVVGWEQLRGRTIQAVYVREVICAGCTDLDRGHRRLPLQAQGLRLPLR